MANAYGPLFRYDIFYCNWVEKHYTLEQIVYQVGLIYRIIEGCTVNRA